MMLGDWSSLEFRVSSLGLRDVGLTARGLRVRGSGIPKPHGGLDAEQSENRLDASTRTGRDVSAVATRPGESGSDPGSHKVPRMRIVVSPSSASSCLIESLLRILLVFGKVPGRL